MKSIFEDKNVSGKNMNMYKVDTLPFAYSLCISYNWLSYAPIRSPCVGKLERTSSGHFMRF